MLHVRSGPCSVSDCWCWMHSCPSHTTFINDPTRQQTPLHKHHEQITKSITKTIQLSGKLQTTNEYLFLDIFDLWAKQADENGYSTSVDNHSGLYGGSWCNVCQGPCSLELQNTWASWSDSRFQNISSMEIHKYDTKQLPKSIQIVLCICLLIITHKLLCQVIILFLLLIFWMAVFKRKPKHMAKRDCGICSCMFGFKMVLFYIHIWATKLFVTSVQWGENVSWWIKIYIYLILTWSVQLLSFCKNSTKRGMMPVWITSSIGGFGSENKVTFDTTFYPNLVCVMSFKFHPCVLVLV